MQYKNNKHFNVWLKKNFLYVEHKQKVSIQHAKQIFKTYRLGIFGGRSFGRYL